MKRIISAILLCVLCLGCVFALASCGSPSKDPEKAKKYATLLYNQALLIAGLPLEDPSGYTDLVCELMI